MWTRTQLKDIAGKEWEQASRENEIDEEDNGDSDGEGKMQNNKPRERKGWETKTEHRSGHGNANPESPELQDFWITQLQHGMGIARAAGLEAGSMMSDQQRLKLNIKGRTAKDDSDKSCLAQ